MNLIMKKFYALSFILLSTLSFGQISISAVNTAYTENFNGMGSTTTYPTGWTGMRVNGSGTLGAILTPVVDDGTQASGNILNLGTTGSADRALGTLGSGSTVPAFGASFKNNTGVTITTLSIAAVMEQWKSGSSSSVAENVAFSYSLDATSLDTGTWTAVTELDLNEKLTSTTAAAAVDGNSTANQTAISKNITGLNWINSANLWIKWVDANDSGSDGAYAIDDFVLKANAVLSIKQNEISGLSMYPNPVKNGNLFITSNSNSAKTVAVFDVLGKQLINTKTSNNAVSVASLKNGVYIVKITEDGKTDTKKLIIE
jgi:hypothetical protein